MKKIFLLFAMLILPALATDIPYGNNGYNSTTCNSGVLQNDSGTVRLRARYEPNQISINWYSGDTELNSTSCNYGGDLNILSASSVPTRPGYTFKGWKTTKVPGGYTELEYIESRGTQYIILNFGFDKTDEIDTKFSVDTSQTMDKYMVSPTTWNNNSNRFGLGVHYNVYTMAYGGDTTGSTLLRNTSSALKGNDGNLHRWIYKNYVVDVPDIGVSRDLSNIYFGTTTTNLKLFYGYDSNTKGKMSYYKHYKNGELTIDLIPARRDSDNIVGLFDTISQTFFTSSNETNFIAGPEVN